MSLPVSFPLVYLQLSSLPPHHPPPHSVSLSLHQRAVNRHRACRFIQLWSFCKMCTDFFFLAGQGSPGLMLSYASCLLTAALWETHKTMILCFACLPPRLQARWTRTCLWQSPAPTQLRSWTCTLVRVGLPSALMPTWSSGTRTPSAPSLPRHTTLYVLNALGEVHAHICFSSRLYSGHNCFFSGAGGSNQKLWHYIVSYNQSYSSRGDECSGN